MAEPVLDISHLSKSFGALKATDDVSLDLRPGEIHALIGPNGAGKTTLMQQISGMLKPIGRHDPFPRRGYRRAGRRRAGAARARPDLPDLVADAGILGAAQRHAGGAGTAGLELPLLRAT